MKSYALLFETVQGYLEGREGNIASHHYITQLLT